MKNLGNEKGVALILELILVALVAGVIAIVGYRTYQAHQAKPTAESATKTTQSTNNTAVKAPNDTNSYLTIKELGAKITLAANTKDLVYKVNTPSYAMVGVDLGMSDTIGTCGYGYLGGIVKVKGTIPSNVTPYYTTDSNGNRLEYFLKQFDGFYIQHFPAQNGCQLPGGSIFPDKATSEAAIKTVATLQLPN